MVTILRELTARAVLFFKQRCVTSWRWISVKDPRWMGSRNGIGEVRDCLVDAPILLEPTFWYRCQSIMYCILCYFGSSIISAEFSTSSKRYLHGRWVWLGVKKGEWNSWWYCSAWVQATLCHKLTLNFCQRPKLNGQPEMVSAVVQFPWSGSPILLDSYLIPVEGGCWQDCTFMPSLFLAQVFFRSTRLYHRKQAFSGHVNLVGYTYVLLLFLCLCHPVLTNHPT